MKVSSLKFQVASFAERKPETSCSSPGAAPSPCRSVSVRVPPAVRHHLAIRAKSVSVRVRPCSSVCPRRKEPEPC